ncbi:hypothetical protein GOODEAATRI_002035, partial [Goodea atripinnis]
SSFSSDSLLRLVSCERLLNCGLPEDVGLSSVASEPWWASLGTFSHLKLVYTGPNQLMSLTCTIFRWFGFFSHRENQNLSLQNYSTTFSLFIGPMCQGLENQM